MATRMLIEDCRQESKQLPALEILNRVVPLIPQIHFRGVRRIVLLDRDPVAKKRHPVVGRYLARKSEIQLYFERYSEIPPELAANELYLAYNLSKTLLHELHHHAVIHQKTRRLGSTLEERRAEDWGEQGARWILKQLYDRETYEAKWRQLQAVLGNSDDQGENRTGASGTA